MDVDFITDDLRRACSQDQEMQRRWGARRALLLRRRLATLRAAPTYDLLPRLPGRFHRLNGRGNGAAALRLDSGWCVVIEPVATQSGTTTVRVLGVEECSA